MNDVLVPHRIRRRRRELGLTGTELADRAGISTSYVSLIETGVRVPEEEIAASIARVLRDDEDLYRAWARAARMGSRDVELIQQLREVAGRLSVSRVPTDEDSAGSTAEGVTRVPVLAAGSDPARPGVAPRRLALDATLLVPHASAALFAYEVTSDMTRLRGVARASDIVVLRPGLAPAADRISAVRTPAGVVLARAVAQENSLLLLPGEGAADFESLPAAGAEALRRLVAGTQVLLIRR